MSYSRFEQKDRLRRTSVRRRERSFVQDLGDGMKAELSDADDLGDVLDEIIVKLR